MLELLIFDPEKRYRFAEINREYLMDIFLTALGGTREEISLLAEIIFQKTYGIPALVKIIFEKIDQQFFLKELSKDLTIEKLHAFLHSIDVSKELDSLFTLQFSAFSDIEKKALFLIALFNKQLKIPKLLEFPLEFMDAVPMAVKKLQEEHWVKVDSHGFLILENSLIGNKVLNLFFDTTQNERESSQGIYEHIFLALPVGIMLVSRSGEIVFANDRSKMITGFSGEIKPNYCWQEFICSHAYSEDIPSCSANIAEVLQTRQPQEVICRFVLGEKITWAKWQVIYDPILDGFINLLVDMTVEKEFERRLQETDEFFQAQSNLSPAGICRLNMEGHLVWANETWLKLSGFSCLEEARGDRWSNALSEEERKIIAPVWANYVKNAIEHPDPECAPYSFEHSFIHSDGKRVSVLAQAAPVFEQINGHLKVKFFVASVADISKLKEAYHIIAEQERILREQAELHRQRSDGLLHDVCHTIKNQLQGLKLCIESLQGTIQELRETTPPEIAAIIPETINEKFASLSEAIQDIGKVYQAIEAITLFELDVFKLKSGTAYFDYQPIDLYQYRMQLSLMFRETVEKKGLQIEFHLEGEPIIKFDNHRLMSLLTNLIDNAIKYTSVGKISVLIEARNQQLILQVSDTGRGMTETFVQSGKLFEQFSRENLEGEGYGIGLPRCQAIVNAMGGHIAVESQLGKGSIFTIDLPYQQPSEDEMRTILKQRKTTNSPPVSPSTFFKSLSPSVHRIFSETKLTLKDEKSLEEFKILVVDDDQLNRKLFSRFLEQAGAEVHLAENGAKGISEVFKLNEYPRVILMDIQMPVLNGIEATRHIRAIFQDMRKTNPLIEFPIIIAITADYAQYHQDDLELFDGYIQKPFVQREVIKKIRELTRIPLKQSPTI